MQKTFFAPFVLGELIAVFSSPAIAQHHSPPNDACSLTTSGQTVNISTLCQGQRQATSRPTPQNSTAPVSFARIRFGMAEIEGQITNRTNRSIHGSAIRYEIIHNRNGRMIIVISGSARNSSPTLEPGQTASFSDTFNQTQTQTLRGYFLNGLQVRFSYQDYTSDRLPMTNDPRLNTPSNP